jgi:hypothetical protein
MSSPDSEPISSVVQWLAAHAGFPSRRLEARAEAMLCVAALAAAEERAAGARFAFERKSPAQAAALRTHALRRSQVHFKCDNSAKV